MSAVKPCLIRSYDAAGGPVVRVGVPLADDYLEFLAGRCRPNTVLAVGYDLRVFFAAVGKPPAEVGPADVLGFITAQRTGRARNDGVVVPLQDGDEPGGVSAGTVRRRLSTISGLFAFLHARGTCRPTRCASLTAEACARRLAKPVRRPRPQPLHLGLERRSPTPPSRGLAEEVPSYAAEWSCR